MPIRIAIADDHELIRKGIIQVLQNTGLEIVADAENGQELLKKLKTIKADIVLMDIKMPVMDGIETTAWLRQNLPTVRVIALSVFDDDTSIIRMLRSGARGYLLKNAKAKELVKAITDVSDRGYHLSEMMGSKLMLNLNQQGEGIRDEEPLLDDREITFLKHCCTEMTYKEIGSVMNVSPRTAEGYGKSLCAKLKLKSRIGLVLYAYENRIVQLS